LNPLKTKQGAAKDYTSSKKNEKKRRRSEAKIKVRRRALEN